MKPPSMAPSAKPSRMGVKPRFQARKIHLQGRSAFPQQAAAFGPTDPALGDPNAGNPLGAPPTGAAGPGEDQA